MNCKASDNSIETKNVTKVFDQDFVAVDNVSLSIKRGDFFSLLGPSGCGKTTLLRIIAGLEDPSEGMVYLNGRIINNIPPQKRSEYCFSKLCPFSSSRVRHHIDKQNT